MNRTSPIGLYNFGVSYIETARAAVLSDGSPRFTDPIEFLCAHGLELVFKGDLVRTRSLEDVKRKFGHDLLKLRRHLSAEFTTKFRIDDEMDNIINYLAIGHSGPNWRNRYLVTGFRTSLTPCQILSPLEKFNSKDRGWLLSHFGEKNS